MPCKLAFDGIALTRIIQARARSRRYHGGKDALDAPASVTKRKPLLAAPTAKRPKPNNDFNLGYQTKLWATTNALPNKH
jgi:hypothetical protein